MKPFDAIREKLNLIRDDELNQEYGKLAALQIIRENNGITEDEILRQLKQRYPEVLTSVLKN